MKIEKRQGFTPITITIESEEELQNLVAAKYDTRDTWRTLHKLLEALSKFL
jgi:hypothetical protein